MEKNPLIPLAVEKYKQQLCADPTRYHSFASFCRSEHLRSESVSQWMRRHGLTVGMLRAQAMLSKHVPIPVAPTPRRALIHRQAVSHRINSYVA